MEMTETAKALAQSIVKGLVAKHNLKLTDEVRAQITNEQKESIHEGSISPLVMDWLRNSR